MIRIAAAIVFGAALSSVSVSASAQADGTYPNKPVRIIVGFTPGSATDVTARVFAQKFTESFGVAVNVENMPGAAGAVSAARVAKLPADGYTLLYGANGALTIAPSLMSKPQYDPTTDFVPVGQLLTMASILAVNNDVPAKSVQELIALAKSRPGQLSYASPGAGTPQHIAGELIKIISKVDITHVPYKGAVFTDVIGGRVTMTLQNFGSILPVIRDGRLRGLAVTSLKRSPSIPQLPTMDESGFPGFEAISWFGFFGPNGMSPAITARVYKESLKVLNDPEVRARFTQLGLDISGVSGAELAAIIKADLAKWAKVIKEAGITAAD